MKLVFFFLTIVWSISGFSQDRNPYFITTQSKAAFLIPHRAAMSHLPKYINKTIELDLSQQICRSAWCEPYNAPMRGLSIIFQDYGNREVLGQGITLSQFTSFSLFTVGQNSFVDFRLGSGLAYITKKYDVVDNPKNNAIGSNLNGYVNFQLSWTHYFKNWHVGTGVEFAHYSNSAIIKPNLGLNTPGLVLILGYHPERRMNYKKELGEFENFGGTGINLPHAFNLTLITTTKQNLPGKNPSRNYPVFALQGIYSHNLNAKWNLETGLDIIYNEANRFKYDEITYERKDAFQIGVYVGAAANILKTQIYFGFGGYVLNPINPQGYIYNRIGYRYHFNQNWNGMLGIMANMGIADYLEFGLGYRFNKKSREVNEKVE